MKQNYNIILSFDLDFTLVDNSEGIINSFAYALQKYDLPPVDKSTIKSMIGTPLDDMFSKFTDFNSTLLCSAFREYYGSKGISQVKLFPGVKDLLKILKKNFLLGAITSKEEALAIKFLQNLDIAKYFDFILGETESRKSKTDPQLIQYLIKKYKNYRFVIIGDHPNDRKLAETLECPFIGVLTGHHSAMELESENIYLKTLILNSVREITSHKILNLF